MALNDLVEVAITRASAALTLAGQQTVLFLPTATHSHFANPMKTYTSPADMLTDGFVSTDQVYLDALKFFSQKNHPTSFKVGKRASAVAQVTTLTIVSAVDGHSYTVTVTDGANAPATATVAYVDGSPTKPEVQGLLVTAINALTINVTAAAVSTDQISMTSDIVGIPFVLSGLDADLTQTATTPNVGLATDLATMNAYDADWYLLLPQERDAASLVYFAGLIAADSTPRLLGAQCNDSTIISAAYNVSTPYTDLFSTLHSLAYDRVIPFYEPTDSESTLAAWVGRCIGELPGSITWRTKQLVGVTSHRLTPDQRANLLTKSGNAYEPIANLTMTYDGTVSSGEYIDIIHGTDAFKQDVILNNAQSVLAMGKIPFTQAGLTVPAQNVLASLKKFTSYGLFADSRTNVDGKLETPAYSVTVPSIGIYTATEKGTRQIPAGKEIKFEATFAGAIHKVRLAGTVSF